jgi:hypothetical protein
MVASQNQRAGIYFDKGRTTRRFTFDSISSGGIRAFSGNSHMAMLKGISIGRKGKWLRMMPFSGLNLRVSSLSPDTCYDWLLRAGRNAGHAKKCLMHD